MFFCPLSSKGGVFLFKKAIITIALFILISVSGTYFLKSYLLIPPETWYVETKSSVKYVLGISPFIVWLCWSKHYKKWSVAAGLLALVCYGMSFMHYTYVTEEEVVQNPWFGTTQVVKWEQVEELTEGEVSKLYYGERVMEIKLPKKIIQKVKEKHPQTMRVTESS